MELGDEEFASDISFEECMEAIAGMREFRVTPKPGGLRVVNYDFCHGGTFPDPSEEKDARKRRLLRIRRECRGLVFGPDGKVVCRRLCKFGNWGQSAESSRVAEELSRQEHVVVEKMDGCMMSAMEWEGVLMLVSKNGPTDLSQKVENAPGIGDWRGLAKKWLGKGWTPTFEWLDPEAPVVLRYDKAELVLVAVREIRTGKHLSNEEMAAEAKQFGLREAPLIWDSRRDGKLDLVELASRVRGEKEREGCVLRLENGFCVKIKTDWYFAQSASHLALPSSERKLWELVLGGTIDDLLPRLSAEVRTKVEAFAARLFGRLAEAAEKKVREEAKKLPETEQGQNLPWARVVAQAKGVGVLTRKLLYEADSDELLAATCKAVCQACGKAKSFDAARKELEVEDVNYFDK